MTADDSHDMLAKEQLRRIIRAGMVEAMPTLAARERVLEELVRRLPAATTVTGNEASEIVQKAASAMSETGVGVSLGTSTVVKLAVAIGLGGGALAGMWSHTPNATHDTVAAAESPESVSAESERDRVSPSAISPRPVAGGATNSSGARRASAKPVPAIHEAARPIVPDNPEPESMDMLAAELALVAEAERALIGGDARRVLDLTIEHARRFPDGQLTIERESIEVSAKCILGEPTAQDAALRFLRAHRNTPPAKTVRTRCHIDPSRDP